MIVITHNSIPNNRSFLRRYVSPRRGAVALVCAMAAAVVFLGISGAAVRTSLRARQERKTERDLHQLSFLLEAGWVRAQAQLRTNPNYEGETWLDQESPYDSARWQVNISTKAHSAENAPQPHVEVLVTARISGRTYSPTILQRTRKRTIHRE